MVHRILNLFAPVRDREVRGVLLMTLNIFVVMTAYYIIKTVREPLILAGETADLLAGGGSEVKSYLAGAQALVLIGAVPLYSAMANRMKPLRLLAAVTLFFVVCIQVFYGAAYLEVPYLGIPFFIWVGIFNLAVIAQFWSFANDLYDQEQGERLFAVLALGMTAGAACGSKIADLLFEAGVGTFEMLEVSAVLLLLTLGLYVLSKRAIDGTGAAEPDADGPEATSMADEGEETEPSDGRGGFALVLANPYIRWIALLFLLLNLVNTTGEFVLANLVETRAAVVAPEDPGAWIGSFYGEFYFWVNIGAIVLQAFVVSRMVRFGGLAAVLFMLPMVALGTYTLAGMGVGLTLWRWAKTAENLTDYSVMNTAKAMIWLPTTRAEKYKAKAAIDTFVVRFGDVASAGAVYVGLNLLGFGPAAFGWLNTVVIVVWLGVAWKVLQHYRAASERMPT